MVAGHGSWWALLRLWVVTLGDQPGGRWAFMWAGGCRVPRPPTSRSWRWPPVP
ncbi:hypothetical protein QJS66_16480 [Kocuria rhizophila]|nr:hypothetical protein QJS66_16480 [Kocuria rhizophila]